MMPQQNYTPRSERQMWEVLISQFDQHADDESKELWEMLCAGRARQEPIESTVVTAPFSEDEDPDFYAALPLVG